MTRRVRLSHLPRHHGRCANADDAPRADIAPGASRALAGRRTARTGEYARRLRRVMNRSDDTPARPARAWGVVRVRRRRAAAGAARRRRRAAARRARACRAGPRPRARRSRAPTSTRSSSSAPPPGDARAATPPPVRRRPPRASPLRRLRRPSSPSASPDFVDFYASLEHATNFGRIFRPGTPPVRDNWRHMPVGYHGRASTIVVSGTRRSAARAGRSRSATLAPTARARPRVRARLRLRAERRRARSRSIAPSEHIFGVVLVNDWSARDVQRLEYEPLGPFLGKSFATSMSAWITPLDGARRARASPPPPQDPAARALPARADRPWLLDVDARDRAQRRGRLAPAPRAACTGRPRRCSPT